MTACQTVAQSLSASPSATSYPTTQFSLPPSYHHEISDLSAYNRSFPSKIKCWIDRLSWLPNSDIQQAGGLVLCELEIEVFRMTASVTFKRSEIVSKRCGLNPN